MKSLNHLDKPTSNSVKDITIDNRDNITFRTNDKDNKNKKIRFTTIA